MSGDQVKKGKKPQTGKAQGSSTSEVSNARRPWTSEEDKLLNDVVNAQCNGGVVSLWQPVLYNYYSHDCFSLMCHSMVMSQSFCSCFCIYFCIYLYWSYVTNHVMKRI